MNSQFSVDELQDKYLFSEQVKLLYAGKPLVLIISSIVAIAFAYIQWSVLDQTSLIIWLSLMFSVIVSRTVLYFMYRRTVPDIDHTNMWYRLFVTGTATAGLLWASLVYWGIPEHDLIYQNFTIILLIGMTAGAITTQSFRKIPFLVFILPILLSLMWYFLNSQLAVGTALGVATILYFVGLSAAALNMNRATIQVICSKYEMGKKDIALEESERRYQNILETAVDAFFLHDLHGRFLDTNQQACRNLGYTRDELLQRYVFDIEMKASTDRDLGSMWDEMSEGESATLIGEHKRKDGSTFPVEVRVRALKSQGMKLFSVLARDITERKLAEEALRLSEEQATAQYKGMPLPTYTWHFRDNEFYLEDYNDAAEKFTTSADNLFSASSNDMRVRVEFSKNKLAMVISLNEGTFFIGRLSTSLKLSAVLKINSISLFVKFFIPNKCGTLNLPITLADFFLLSKHYLFLLSLSSLLLLSLLQWSQSLYPHN